MSAPILGLCVWGIYARQFILPSYGVQWMDYFRFHTLGKFPAFGSREDYHVLLDRHIRNVLSLMAQQIIENISFYTTIRCYTMLVHCNWEWSGKGNGYFAANCFQSRAGVEYDDVTDVNNTARIPFPACAPWVNPFSACAPWEISHCVSMP